MLMVAVVVVVLLLVLLLMLMLLRVDLVRSGNWLENWRERRSVSEKEPGSVKKKEGGR